MIDSLRLYIRYQAISIRAQMQYRVSFLLLSLSTFLGTGIEFAGMWVLFQRFGGLRQWTLPQAALFYGMVHVAFAITEAFARGFDTFDRLVRSGDFDRLLLRPAGTAFQVAASELQLMRIGRLSQGLAVLIWAALRLQIAWTAPKLALLVAAILGGAAIFAGLFILQATLAFWTIDSLEIVNTVTYGGVETAQFPLSIYNPWFRRFFTFCIPLACINYYPAHAILSWQDPLGSPAWFHWVAPAVGALFLVGSLQVWKLGVRRYCSTGS